MAVTGTRRVTIATIARRSGADPFRSRLSEQLDRPSRRRPLVQSTNTAPYPLREKPLGNPRFRIINDTTGTSVPSIDAGERRMTRQVGSAQKRALVELASATDGIGEVPFKHAPGLLNKGLVTRLGRADLGLRPLTSANSPNPGASS